ncbi:MAG: hypothetical protein JSU04_09500 [Bdellovibrionales bacterium]|nr:hypothetical protein [Bdellovibrionales bacterium]
MEVCNYEFETREDREMAFHNIVKWYGDSVVTKVEFLELTVTAPKDVAFETEQIVTKHLGRLKR